MGMSHSSASALPGLATFPCALTIAGSDSGGGAGIQADLKAFAAHGVHGLSAIAALTAQHTRGVTAVHVPPLDFLRAQIDACFDDFDIGAVKIGMLANADVINAVADGLQAHGSPPLVLDPVMIATSGARLLETSALDALRARLLPGAAVLTPNLPEAELLLGRTIADRDAMRAAAADLLTAGARAVLSRAGTWRTAQTTSSTCSPRRTAACTNSRTRACRATRTAPAAHLPLPSLPTCAAA